MLKLLAEATVVFTTICSAMMGIVWITNKVTSLVEPWITPIIEESIDDE